MNDAAVATDAALIRMLLHREVEAFLFEEADAVDRGQFDRWLEFFSDDVRYWIPLRRNVAPKERDRDVGGDRDVAWVDDNKAMMQMRVAQIQTGLHWAEEPPSRVAHLVSNVRLVTTPPNRQGAEFAVTSRVLVHRTRMETETALLVGLREDTLRRAGDSFQICRRKIILNHHTLLTKNLSFFI